MEIERLAILKNKVVTLKSALIKGQIEKKETLITIHMANQFNEVIESFSKKYPYLKEDLPKKIGSTGPFSMMELADASYFDLEVYCDELLGLIRIIETGE